MAITDTSAYTGLITSEHATKPKFVATVSFSVAPFAQLQSVMASLDTAYDLDFAVGVQLDGIGAWVGVSRNVSIPISGAYFSWNATNVVGWNSGSWAPFNAPTSITVLPDDAYRTLIRAKIGANHWDGTTEGAYAIYRILFPQLIIGIIDGNNTTFAMIIVGNPIDSITLALITGGDIPLKPEGVRITEYFVAVDTNPIFGWDLETASIQGYDQGSWASELAGP